MNSRAFFLLPLIGLVVGWLMGAIAGNPLSPATKARHVAPDAPTKADGNPALQLATESADGRHMPREKSEETLRIALSHSSALHRIGAFASLLDHLTAGQFEALNAELAALNPAPDIEILGFFFRRWAQVAPEAAVTAAKKKDVEWQALMAWGETDPAAALARFEQLTYIHGFGAASLRDHLRELAMPKPGQLPPRDAVQRIRELQGEGQATPAILNSMSGILTEWTKTDPEAAWREALELPAQGNARETREWALSSIIRARTGADPEGVLRWLNAIPKGKEHDGLEASYVSALVSSGKSRQAREYALAMPEGGARRKAVGEIASALFRQDAEATKAFVAGLTAEDWRDPTVFSDIFEEWLPSEPQRAAEVLLKHFPADAPSGPAQQAAYARMFFGWSGNHPREASDFFLKLPDAIGAKLLDDAVSSFCYGDAAAAAEWAAALPPNATRERIMGRVAEQWTRFGATQVTQWLDTLPSNAGKSAAIEGFAKAIISTSPDDALAWLHSVPSESERLDRLSRVWRAWTDREAAQRWAETSPELTDAERRVLHENSKPP